MWCLSQNSRNFCPVNCVPLSVIMELGTPNRWMISVKNSTACSALILVMGRTSIHLENLLICDKQVGEAPGCLLQRPDEVEAPDSKGPGDGDRLQSLSGEMNLPSIELASLIGPHDLRGIGQSGRPVETLSEGVSH